MTDTFTIGTASDLAADINLGKQARKILAHLKEGKTITNLESVLVYGIYRLSDVVFKLRNAGYDVHTYRQEGRSRPQVLLVQADRGLMASCTKAACPCGTSSDAFATYDDGSVWCFSCGDPKNFAGQGRQPSTPPDDDFAEKTKKPFTPLKGHYADITARGITEDTCKKCDYQIGENDYGTRVHIQLIKDDNGRLIDQKTRDKDKHFAWVGQSKYTGIIGSWSWPAKGKNVTITEGEIDRMSVSQAFDNKWPTGSLPNGADSVKKAILTDYEKLCGFDTIVLCFDNDAPGQEALKIACELLPVGKVKIMTLDKKDANATLMAKELGPAALMRAFWDAKPYRPDGIREGRDFTVTRMKQKRKQGVSLPFPMLNDMWAWGPRRRGDDHHRRLRHRQEHHRSRHRLPHADGARLQDRQHLS
jgi:hypothetical protein